MYCVFYVKDDKYDYYTNLHTISKILHVRYETVQRTLNENRILWLSRTKQSVYITKLSKVEDDENSFNIMAIFKNGKSLIFSSCDEKKVKKYGGSLTKINSYIESGESNEFGTCFDFAE